MVWAVTALFSDGYFDRIAQIFLGDLANIWRHGCRKKGGLFSAGKLLENPFDIVEKTHSEHFVSFIEDQAVNAFSFKSAAAQVIHNSARGADHDLHAFVQLAQLNIVVLATENSQYVEVF